MARIRSLHPTLFTDENYMAVSIPARELIKGLWCEADDQGVFQWKPLTIKARIFPADAISVEALLDELAERDFIKAFDVDGRRYGAIRNFRKFQRPKKPNAINPLPTELNGYVGLSSLQGNQRHKQGLVPNSSLTGGEQRPQMEDGGGRREDVGESEPTEEKKLGEVVPLAARARRAARYGFEGLVIRVTTDQFDQWRKTFYAIADLTAELTSIDAWLHSHDSPKDWFHRTTGMLNKKHQEALAIKAKASIPIEKRYPNEGVYA